MARFKNGWVKIYRAAILGDIGSNYIRGGLFQALIAIANIQTSMVSWAGKPRRILRGEMVTSLMELAELGEIDVKTVNRHLNYLQLRGTISIEKCSTGTFIKINNFEQYQGQDAEGSKRGPNDGDDDRDNEVQTTGIHIEELKNIRIKETKNADFDFCLSEFLKFKGTIKGSGAQQRFESQMKSPEALADFKKALENYRQVLAANPWRHPKSSFAVFVGTKKSGFFWRDFIDVTTIMPDAAPVNYAGAGFDDQEVSA